MNKLDYDNFIRQQVFSLSDLVGDQIVGCFGKNLTGLMTGDEIAKAKKIIITGCGDSYAAALALLPAVNQYSGCDAAAMRAVEFTRFFTADDIGDTGSTVVIGISTGGGTARVAEVLEKANAVGAFSVLITNNGESRCASIAKRTLVLGTPSFPNDLPGLRSYFGSLMGIIAITAHFGEVKGALPAGSLSKWENVVTKYVKSFASHFDAIDSQMYALAQRWVGCNSFDFIGDGVEHASAFFGAAKFLECVGAFCNWDDSEDWCHVGYFLKDPEHVGTVFMADRNSPSFGRVCETVGSAKKVGRPVLVVTNADAGSFIEGADVCVIPDAPKGFEWLMPLMDYCPASLLAGYVSALRGEPYFRATYTADGQPDPNNPWKTSMTIRTSNTEIYA